MKVIINAGIYDLTHRGHIALFKRMRAAGDFTIAVVHDDRSCYEIKDKIPVQSFGHRIRNVQITGLIDEVVECLDADPGPVFRKVVEMYGRGNELIYMRGDDLMGAFPGRYVLDELGVPIQFVPYTDGVSSTFLRDALG